MNPGYAGVCIENPHRELDRLFHYRIPVGMAVRVGMRCVVPFGKGDKPLNGFVMEVSGSPGGEDSDTPPHRSMKEISAVPDDFCVLPGEMLELAKWMQGKYYTTLISCLRCITPAAKADAGGAFPGTKAKRKTRTATPPDIVLTDAQREAVEKITAACDTAFLLHGVTGSGKTEVYLHAIAHVLAQGRQAIVLVPEIALTPQMVDVFTARFGDDVAVTHSRLTAGERFAIWQQAREGVIKLVIGPRSAVFMPFARLGLIVIDEEHEHTYHSEQSPKYDAREVALKRAELTGATVVLGSATPSVETYLKATCGEFILLNLPHRINRTLPAVRTIDMRREPAGGNVSIFSQEFIQALNETLSAGRQAILFLNRRGYSNFVSCRQCGEVLTCKACRVNYTYHATNSTLLCHYCGQGTKLPEKCPVCQSVHLRRFGVGTQQVESEVARLFPAAGTLRMDFDTTKGKNGHEQILSAFRRGAADVLVGTQMVAKGLDFPNVTLVGVIAADMSLFTGDFRAAEHTFQLLTQVAGRAGRANYAGQVFFQTYNPRHYALQLAQNGTYENFFAHEISLRRTMNYPPFSHIFSVMLSGPNEREVIAALHKLQAIMAYCNKKNRFELMGVSPCFVSKVREQFRWKILVKCPEEEPLKQFVIYCTQKLRENDPLTHISVHLSLNPVMME